MSAEYITSLCFEVRQPAGTFYVARISAEDLIEITYTDVRRIEKEERDVELVLGIQRPLSSTRVAEIGDYVNTIDATFPSSIILAVSSHSEEDEDVRNLIFDRKAGTLRIRKDARVAKVLDGQHRIEGLNALKPENRPFDLLVAIFVDSDLEEQALIFATINKTQTKVNKSLVYDLFELAKNRSPEKTCHNIAILLNEKVGSPFKDKIKILGTADDSARETLTQATFVEALLKYISNEPMKDRDFIKRNPTKLLPKVEGEKDTLFLRSWFRDENDAMIARLVWDYFDAVRSHWPEAWDSPPDGGLILNRSTGFRALMRFLKPACEGVNLESKSETRKHFKQLFEGVIIRDRDFTKEEFIPGSSGQRALFTKLMSDTEDIRE